MPKNKAEVKSVSDVKSANNNTSMKTNSPSSGINPNVNSNNYLNRARGNPWMISSFVLGVVVIILIAILGLGGGSKTVVSEKEAADNLVLFIKSQSKSNADFKVSSVEQQGQIYKITLDYQGQSVPVYVSLDGKYLFSDIIPLDTSLSPSNASDSKQVDVEVGDSPVKGDANAPVVIIEFSDYQCPFCGKFYSQTLSSIEEQYIKTGKVKLVYKDFPLISIHPEAQKAAEAARCVREQKGDEGYFKMHDKLFENQQDLSVENEKKWARSLGVVGSKFDDCLDKGKYAKAIQDEEAYGEKLGVSGTPAFFINGKFINGAQPFDVFKQVIDAELSNI